MAFKVIVTLVLLNFAYFTFGAVSRSRPSTHPNHPNKCWFSETQTAHDPGSEFTHKCTRITCESDLSFEYATCGVIGTEPPCYVVDGDLTLSYPHCCPTVKCD